MSTFFPPLLSFFIAATVTLLELITSKYPRTSFLLLKRSHWLYVYVAIYGAISFAVTIAFKWLIQTQEEITVTGLAISNPWAQAVIVGLSVKAFLHIRLFAVTVGSQAFPVGVETLVQLFEPWLLRTIDLDEFNAMKDFIADYQQHYDALGPVKDKIKQNIPTNLPKEEKSAFLADLDEKEGVGEAMELYLQSFGKTSFKRVFPLS